MLVFQYGDRVRYVSRNHNHPYYGAIGMVLAQGRGSGPRNVLVKLDSGRVIVAPWGNWRRVPEGWRNERTD